MSKLALYNKKRDFKQTREPKGEATASGKFRFVVQRHHATRLHYDFRLELDAVLKSWAVPRGPSMNPADKRLAVEVEDHPVSYIGFKGEIPKGNYGAGKVEIWDKGVYFPINEAHEKISEKQALAALKKGELKVLLKGEKIAGEFVLVRLKDGKNWLLIKHRDEYAVDKPYDSEKFAESPAPKKAAKKKAARRKTATKKTATNKSTTKNVATRPTKKRRPPIKGGHLAI